MKPLSLLACVGFVILGGTVAAVADDKTTPEAWQDVIDSQIAAFHTKDAPTAFGLAGAAFQVAYPNAEAFLDSIIGAGYGPIADSRSHEFGNFRMLDEHTVLQVVDLIGDDLGMYEAFYQLSAEKDGWRVEGVKLMKMDGLAI